MPTLLGIECSSDVLELNQHLATSKATAQPRRKAVTRWKSEREFQAAVFKATAWEALRQPAFRLLFHIPNEGSHKQPGVKGGVPDLFLAVPSGGKAGLFIELKIGDGKPSRAQLDVMSELRAAGYQCHVIWDSVDQVIETIHGYLKGA